MMQRWNIQKQTFYSEKVDITDKFEPIRHALKNLLNRVSIDVIINTETHAIR